MGCSGVQDNLKVASKQETSSTTSLQVESELDELPRLLAIEPWLQHRSILFLGDPSEKVLMWLKRLGAATISVLGAGQKRLPNSIENWDEEGGISAIPSESQELIFVEDLGARLAEGKAALQSLRRIMTKDGILLGVLPADGEHVGMSMMAHAKGCHRLTYEQIIDLLENHFEDVAVASQVPILGYAVLPNGIDGQLHFDARIHNTAEEPPLYYLICASAELPPDPEARLVTLSYDRLSDRVGQVVADLSDRLRTLEDGSRARRQEQQAVVQDLTQRLGEIEDREKESVSALSEASDNNRQLEAALQDRDTQLVHLKQRQSELTERLSHTQHEHEAQTKALERAMAEARQLADQLEDRDQQTTQRFEQETATQKANNEALEAAIKTAKTKLSATEKELAEQTQARHELEALQTDLNNQVSQLETEVAQLTTEYRKVEALHRKDDLLKERLLTMTNERNRFSRSASTLAVTAEHRAAECYRLKNRGQRLNRELRRVRLDASETQRRRLQLEQLLADAQSLIEDQANSHRDAESQSALATHLQQQLSHALVQEEELNERLNQLDQSLDDSRAQLEEETQLRRRIETTAQGLAEQLQRQEAELEALHTQKQNSLSTLDALKQQLTDNQARMEQVQSDHDDLEEKYQSEAKERLELVEKLTDSRGREQALEQEVKRQQEAVTERDEELQAVNLRLESARLTASTVQESLSELRARGSSSPEPSGAEDALKASLKALAEQGENLAKLEAECALLQSQISRQDESGASHLQTLHHEQQARIANLIEERTRQEAEVARLRAEADQAALAKQDLLVARQALETLQSEHDALVFQAGQLSKPSASLEDMVEQHRVLLTEVDALREHRRQAEAQKGEAEAQLGAITEEKAQAVAALSAAHQATTDQEIAHQTKLDAMEQRYRQEIKALRLVFDQELTEALQAAERREAQARAEAREARSALPQSVDNSTVADPLETIQMREKLEKAEEEIDSLRRELRRLRQESTAAGDQTQKDRYEAEREARERAEAAISQLESENAQLMRAQQDVDNREQEMLRAMEERANQQDESRAFALAQRAARLLSLIERLEHAAPRA